MDVNQNTGEPINDQRRLDGKRVAILVADGFEQVELTEPRRALDEAGASTQIVSPSQPKVKGWQHTKWGDEFDVDVKLDQSDPTQFDALLLPGGVMNPDKLRMNARAVEFVRHFFDQGKPIAAICHGPWTLIEAGAVKRRTVTSYPSIKTDLTNAGAKWVDEPVVVDNGLITSRRPDDIPMFNGKMIEEFAEGKHGRRGSRGARRREGARAGGTRAKQEQERAWPAPSDAQSESTSPSPSTRF
jgi:protease I